MYEYSFWQQEARYWAPFWRWIFGIPDWAPQECDVLSRPLDATTVGSSEPVEWPTGWGTTKVQTSIGTGLIDGLSLPGLTMQRVGTTADAFYMNNTYTGEARTVNIPRPLKGYYWTEGMPCRNGAYDRHFVGVADDGTVTEAIQLSTQFKTILSYGVFAPDGTLVEGQPQTAAGVSLSRIMYRMGDPYHRLGIAVTDYSGRDGTKDWAFPKCGDIVRLSAQARDRELAKATTNEARDVVNMLNTHGAVIFDRGGDNRVPGGSIAIAAGAQNRGQLNSIAITFGDLERVTS